MHTEKEFIGGRLDNLQNWWEVLMRTRLGLCTGDRNTIKVLTQQLPLKSPALSSSYCFWYGRDSSLPPTSLRRSLQISRPGQLHPTLHASSQESAERGTLWPAAAASWETSPASNISWEIQELGRQNCQIFTTGTSPKLRIPSSQRGVKPWGVCSISMSWKTGMIGLYFVLSRSFTFPWPGFKDN